MFDAFDEGGGLGATHHRGEGWGRPGRHEAGAPEAMGGAAGRGVTGMAFRDVLQHVYVREAERDAHEPADLRRLNGRLLCVLTACHEVDTARRRLMGSLNTQQTLKSLAHLLTARGDAGLGPGTEQRKLTEMLADLRCTVEMAHGDVGGGGPALHAGDAPVAGPVGHEWDQLHPGGACRD
ncbi:hypothetical protein ACFJGX_07360 [Hydrogenophaga sp. UC242_50]|uniref:hypothetical protein n=1 Tax=Hydrogenophaga sp. UC242_50 TaxID=3350169 RepID=UPI0036D409B2